MAITEAPRPSLDSPSARSSSSFATLRKSRDAKKTFVEPDINSTTLKSSAAKTTRMPTPPSTAIPPVGPQAPPSQGSLGPRNGASSSRSDLSPPDPDAPGATLLLLRHISPLSPPEAWSLLSSYPPSTIPRLLAPVLEPDVLGQVLLALQHAALSATEQEEETVRTIMEGLKTTPRWTINVAMLSLAERSAGERAWTTCGGEGNWP